MKVQLDTTALRRELHKVIFDDKKCAQWLRDFEYTLGCWGTNENPHPFAMRLVVEAEGYKAKQSMQKMRSAVLKELGQDADEKEVKAKLFAKYGKKVKDICEAIERAESLSADATTREDVENVSDSDNAGKLEPATSADTETLDSLTDKDAQPVDGRAAAKPSRTTPPQNSYGEFNNVRMTTAEFEKFVQAVGADRANALIEELSSYLASSGKRYKSHYATLLNWSRRKDKEGEPKQKFLTADDISRRNYEESKKQLAQILGRASNG